MRGAFSRQDWWRVAALLGAVAALHVVGWGLVLLYAPDHPVLAGLASLAYTFGLRHAFDVDHITAIDNTTRKLLQDGKRPLGIGLSFSLGHSTVVLTLCIGLAVAAEAMNAGLPGAQHYGGIIGASVSGTFLLVMGVLNLVVLLDLVRIARAARGSEVDEAGLEQRLNDRGLMNRWFFGRLTGLVRKTWHMYPLGVLFGLGFDTATEVGLLAVTAGASTGETPLLAILALPILFAAGMTLFDTIDGILMSGAYGWALRRPVRRVFYNVTVTGLSVVVALLVGAVEVVQVLGETLGLDGAVFAWLDGISFETLGYVIVALFAVTGLAATTIWRVGRIEERWG